VAGLVVLTSAVADVRVSVSLTGLMVNEIGVMLEALKLPSPEYLAVRV
jgi:hypothetical protein